MGTCSKANKKKKNSPTDNGRIEELPDDVLINILSRLSLKEGGRASVLARRWRYLWRFAFRILRFDQEETASGNVMEREKFESWVNTVLELQKKYIEGMIITYSLKGHKPSQHVVDGWVRYAVQKEVQSFELILTSDYYLYGTFRFTSVERLLKHSDGVTTTPFCRLRTLRLGYMGVEDELVHYFLASFPSLEELRIKFSNSTKNVRVMDPPRLTVLEISGCSKIESLEISSANLVSLTYEGRKDIKEHWSYSVQLEKLVLDFGSQIHERLSFGVGDLPRLRFLRRLEVRILTQPGHDLVFFRSLITAFPRLHELKIELSYTLKPYAMGHCGVGVKFPGAVNRRNFVHRALKAVEVVGFTGLGCEKRLLSELMEIGRGSIERVVIDTDSTYYNDPLLDEYLSQLRGDAGKYIILHTGNETSKSVLDFLSRYQGGYMDNYPGKRIGSYIVNYPGYKINKNKDVRHILSKHQGRYMVDCSGFSGATRDKAKETALHVLSKSNNITFTIT
ncbi:hypothetical protein OROMI_026726 [Orobanche minor]